MGDEQRADPGDGHVAGGDLRIHPLDDMDDLRAAAELLRAIWGGDAWPVQPALLRANAHAGNYVSGAWLDDRMVGASMGFLAHPTDPVLHSHITGVVAGAAGHGIGRALKEHQAEWCRSHGIDRITWTFDPLVARNAWFNLTRLGAVATEYLVDFYGEMPDDRNRGQGSDRLHVAWDVRSPSPGDVGAVPDALDLLVDDHGRPRPVDDVPPDAGALAVAVPADVEHLRDHDPDLAERWRHAVRDALAPRLGTSAEPGGWRLAGFTRDRRHVLVPAGRSDA